MKKVLVTGASGFIGNYVVGELLKRGMHVIASSAHAEKAKSLSWIDRVTYIPFDFSHFDVERDYFTYFNSPDVVIHLAWEGLPDYKADFHLERNYPRDLAFLGNLIHHGLKDLSVTGTCFEYGMQEGMLREDQPAFPENAYGRAKDALRRGLEALQQQYSFTFRWVRLFYMYGKGQNPKSLYSQLDRALAAGQNVFNMSGGEQVRDYLPVEKVAGYIVSIALQDQVTGIINCCSGRPATIKELVEEYLRREEKCISLNLGYYPYADYEPMRFWGSDEKLRSVPGIDGKEG